MEKGEYAARWRQAWIEQHPDYTLAKQALDDARRDPGDRAPAFNMDPRRFVEHGLVGVSDKAQRVGALEQVFRDVEAKLAREYDAVWRAEIEEAERIKKHRTKVDDSPY